MSINKRLLLGKRFGWGSTNKYGTKILNLQTRVRFPVALPALKYSCDQSLTAYLPRTTIHTVCSVLCSLHNFISFVDCHPDLLQAGMLVKSRHVHFAVAHDIHYRHHIARSVHRIGTEPVPSTIEHNGLG